MTISSAPKDSSIPAEIATLAREAIAERSISDIDLIAVDGDFIRSEEGVLALKKVIDGNGNFSLQSGYIRGKYYEATGPYQLRVKLVRPLSSANGLTVHYRIEGWEEIRYLAIGHTTEEGFRHVKIVNPSQQEWVTFSLGYQDIAFGLKNDWEKPAPRTIKDVRLYISGKPKGTASISLAWASTWLEKPGFESPSENPEPHPDLFNALKNYFRRHNRKLDKHAEEFLNSGNFPTLGDRFIAWAPQESIPEALGESGTYRYLWHALQPAISLMVYADDRNSLPALFAARDFLNGWLERSFFAPDPDIKYAWYDHGAAERQMAFLLMHEMALHYGFDRRFLVRLQYAILKHAQLLESEVFYASHQRTRYHNHAWFQDIALIASALAMRSFTSANRWRKRALERFSDQLDKLIVRDGGFAISIENSIGYHQGIQRLAEFAGELTELAGIDAEITNIAFEICRWSEFFRYPDRRAPSQGDTFRFGNPAVATERFVPGQPYDLPQVEILSEAGYAVVKGNHEGTPFMLCMFATSRCKTHKHEDDLSLTLFLDGIEWFIDPSFYSHDYDEKIPAFLRSDKAHTKLVLDNRPYSIEPGLTRVHGETVDGEATIEGFSTAYDGATIIRRLRCGLDSFRLSGHDKVQAENADVSGSLVFHCGENVDCEVSGNSVILSHALSKYLLSLSFPTDSAIEVFKGWVDGRPFNGISGGGYRESVRTTQIVVPLAGKETDWEIIARPK